MKLWDMTTGQERFTLRGHTDIVRSVAFSLDGKIVASASFDKTLKLWDVASGKERATLQGHTDHVWFVAFSPDGKSLASTSRDGTVRFWDLTTGRNTSKLKGNNCLGGSVAFSLDGKTLATNNGPETVGLWDVATGEERATLQGHTNCVASVAFSPDGKTLASASWDRTVKVWDVDTGRERATLKGHTSIVVAVAYSPDGKTLASASRDHTIKLWEAATGAERATLQGQTEEFYSVAYSPDGKTLASTSTELSVRLWNLLAAKKAKSAESEMFTTEELEGLWTTLAADDAGRACQTIGVLVGAPAQAVPLLQARVRRVSKAEMQEVRRWIADLDSPEFAVRETAGDELEKKGDLAASALRRRWAEKPSLDMRRRIDQLLPKIERLSPDSIRALRAVEVLEHIGTTDARKVMETLASGAEGARLTDEAKTSLARLNKRAVVK